MGAKNKGNFLNNLTFIIPFILTVFGIFMIYEASSISASRIFNDTFYFVKHQSGWLVLAIGVFLLFYNLDYHLLHGFSLLMLLGNLFLLLLVFLPGLYSEVLGAKRWLNIGGFRLQPSEFTKLTLIVYLSAWFTNKEKERFLAFILLTSVLIGLVMLQPDMGTAFILGAMASFLYFLSGAPLSHFLILFSGALSIGGLMILTSPYRLQRVITFLNPASDLQGIGYHINQINIALSLGGWFGVGFGNSRQKFQFLPEAHTDSIFAIIGENFGLIGTSLILGAYIVFFIHTFKQIREVKDRLGFLLGSGILLLILLQVLVNLGAMVQLLPLTGIPLPFISYGGSSLLTFYALIGILANIIKHNKRHAK